ncbi:hypothetical protein FIBSPDRAFT_102964 [Athelia psychrophila]|uniref:Uncharacterized protein n=1 Tax=Athelia psychrophila TaxID=1759441 RepID=A0A166DFG0_9AGAM|nr:hypothetical protein FIBSPDRAFT_102964 [Fibularhizoctonia sp. CBS 109695]
MHMWTSAVPAPGCLPSALSLSFHTLPAQNTRPHTLMHVYGYALLGNSFSRQEHLVGARYIWYWLRWNGFDPRSQDLCHICDIRTLYTHSISIGS